MRTDPEGPETKPKSSTKLSADPLGDRPFLFSFLVTAGLMALAALFLKPYFLTNDDVDGLFISQGIGTVLHPDEHLFFSSVLLGFPLKWLQGSWPGPAWYAWAELTAEFIAFWALLAGLLLRNPGRWTAPLFALCFLFIGPFFFYELNYTAIAILDGLGALFLLGALGERPGRDRDGPILCLGGGALFLSLFFRPLSLLWALLLLAPSGILWLRRWSWDRKKAVILLGLAFGSLLAVGSDGWYSQKDMAWRDFTRDYRAEVQPMLYGGLSLNERTKPYFDEVGWSRNDLDLFRDFYFLDLERYSPEKIARLTAHFPSAHFQDGPQRIREFLEAFRADGPVTTRNYSILFAAQSIGLCVLFLFLYQPKEGMVPFLLSGCWSVGCVLFLAAWGRAPERLFLPAILQIAALGLLGARPDKGWLPGVSRKVSVLVLGLWALAAVPTLFVNGQIDRRFQEREGAVRASLEALHPSDKDLFVVWTGHLPFEDVRALDAYNVFRPFHFFHLSCFQSSPLSGEMLQRYGVRDLFRDLVDRSDRFLICRPEQKPFYEGYLMERFRLKVRWEEISPNDAFHVYRVHSQGHSSRS